MACFSRLSLHGEAPFSAVDVTATAASLGLPTDSDEYRREMRVRSKRASMFLQRPTTMPNLLISTHFIYEIEQILYYLFDGQREKLWLQNDATALPAVVFASPDRSPAAKAIEAQTAVALGGLPVCMRGFDAKDLQRAQFSLFSILAHTYHRLLSRFQLNEALSKSKLQLSTDACWGRCIDVPAGVSTPTGSIARQ